MSKESEQAVNMGFAVGGVGLLGFIAFYFVGELVRARRSARQPRQPWDLG